MEQGTVSEGNNTRFLMRLPGLRMELEGEKTFVEELYRVIKRDFAPVIEAASKGASPREAVQPQPPQRRIGHTWVYLCTAYFNKVYVIENSGLEASMLGPFIDIDNIRRIYVDRENSPVLASLAQSDRTLWAEFTDEGKAALRGAMSGKK